jgi:hypothetical protein
MAQCPSHNVMMIRTSGDNIVGWVHPWLSANQYDSKSYCIFKVQKDRSLKLRLATYLSFNVHVNISSSESLTLPPKKEFTSPRPHYSHWIINLPLCIYLTFSLLFIRVFFII